MVYWENPTTEQHPSTSTIERNRVLVLTLTLLLITMCAAFTALAFKVADLEATAKQCHGSASANYWQVAALQYELGGDQDKMDNAGQEVARQLNNIAARSIVHAYNDCDDAFIENNR